MVVIDNGNQFSDYRIFISTNDGKLFCIGDRSIVDANTSPLLTSPLVDPDTGDTNNQYTFSVIYTDNDDDYPNVMQVYIDDVPFDMYKTSNGPKEDFDSDYTNGEKYIYRTGLFEGTHEFYFGTDDGTVKVFTDLFEVEVESLNPDPNGNNDNGTSEDSNSDNEASGFTPGFEGVFLIGCILFCMVWLKKRRLE